MGILKDLSKVRLEEARLGGSLTGEWGQQSPVFCRVGTLAAYSDLGDNRVLSVSAVQWPALPTGTLWGPPQLSIGT